MEIHIVTCQQFNANDKSYKVLEKIYMNGEKIKKGVDVFSLDSSKAVLDIESEAEGFFYTTINVGDFVTVGEPLYIISKNLINNQARIDSYFSKNNLKKDSSSNIHSSKIVTKNARELLKKYSLNENDFEEQIITEELVNFHIKKRKGPTIIFKEDANYKKLKRLAFIGAGQGLVQVLDIVFNTNEYIPITIYDDTPEKHGLFYYNIPVNGKINKDLIIEDYKNGLFDEIINTVSISIEFRKKIYIELHSAGVPFGNLIHFSSNIGFNNNMGEGNVILPQVSIGPCTVIGNNNFISAHCNIEHHNVLGNHCTFGPGIMTSGNVLIGDEVKFGTGIFIEPRLSIGNNSIIASGSIINRNIEENVIAYPHGSSLSFKKI